jgi:GNAT superfamily N-acetyltransferase
MSASQVTPVTIRPVDVYDDAELHAFHTALEEALRHGRPYSSFVHEAEHRALLQAAPTDERVEPFAAFDGAQVLGAGTMFFPLLDNRDKVYFELGTRPAFRGLGIGSALVEHVLARAAAEGRGMLIGDSHYPLAADADHPHRRFAARHGFTVGNEEPRRVLRLPLPEEKLAAWERESAAKHAGYRIETYVDDVPERLLTSYVHLLNQLAVDAPTGDIDFEAGAVPVEVYLANAERAKATGRTTYRSVAIATGADGREEAVAHTTLVCPPAGADEPNLYQWGTLVRRDHRGHRLGMAVKLANLRAIQADRPERTIVTTTNSAANGPMVAINEQLGFTPVDISAELVRRL